MNRPLLAAWLVQALLLASCATPPAQPPSLNLIYQPEAVIKDSVYAIEQGRATFCVVLSVDGTDVANSIGESIRASAGMGNLLLVRRLNHPIPPGHHSLSIGCRSVSPAPIFDAFNNFAARGTVELSAAKEHTYVVRARFDGATTSAWIEDEASGAPVSASVSGGS